MFKILFTPEDVQEENGSTPEENGSTPQGCREIKASRFTPKEFRIFFTLLLKKSSISPTYPGRIPFPGNKKPAFRYIECRTGGWLSLHGSQTKKANHET